MFGSVSIKSYHPQISSRNLMTSFPCGVSSEALKLDWRPATSSRLLRSIIFLGLCERLFSCAGVFSDLRALLHFGHLPLRLRTLRPAFPDLLNLVIITKDFDIGPRDRPDFIR